MNPKQNSITNHLEENESQLYIIPDCSPKTVLSEAVLLSHTGRRGESLTCRWGSNRTLLLFSLSPLFLFVLSFYQLAVIEFYKVPYFQFTLIISAKDNLWKRQFKINHKIYLIHHDSQ